MDLECSTQEIDLPMSMGFLLVINSIMISECLGFQEYKVLKDNNVASRTAKHEVIPEKESLHRAMSNLLLCHLLISHRSGDSRFLSPNQKRNRDQINNEGNDCAQDMKVFNAHAIDPGC